MIGFPLISIEQNYGWPQCFGLHGRHSKYILIIFQTSGQEPSQRLEPKTWNCLWKRQSLSVSVCCRGLVLYTCRKKNLATVIHFSCVQVYFYVFKSWPREQNCLLQRSNTVNDTDPRCAANMLQDVESQLDRVQCVSIRARGGTTAKWLLLNQLSFYLCQTGWLYIAYVAWLY